MKILIIEDDQSVAELERDYLEINGAHAGPGSLAIFFEGDEHARQH